MMIFSFHFLVRCNIIFIIILFIYLFIFSVIGGQETFKEAILELCISTVFGHKVIMIFTVKLNPNS